MIDWDNLYEEDVKSWQSVSCAKCGGCLGYTYILAVKQPGIICEECRNTLPVREDESDNE